MRKWLTLALTAGALHAASVIRGTVVEDETGHPLARATVTVQAVGEAAWTVQSTRTNANGLFEFRNLAAGAYLISAAHVGFAPVEFGQKRWHAAGVPISVADNFTTSFTIRLPHFGSITGTVLDENDVGIPEQEVAVYSNTRPPKLLERVKTDDRGWYHLMSLPPGKYLVRSMAKLYEDGGYLPTFYRDAATVDQSRSVEVVIERQVDHVDIHAGTGRLFTLAGRVAGGQSGPTSVALSSDTGTQIATIDNYGTFSFNPAAPGQYEILAQAPDRGRGATAGYQLLTLDRDLSDLRIPMGAFPTVRFIFEDTKGQPIDPGALQVMARRKDMGGDTQTEPLQIAFDEKPANPENRGREIRPAGGRVTVLPGRWDVALAPTMRYWVVDCKLSGADNADRGRADGWNEMLLAAGSQNVVKFVLSATVSTLRGTVKSAGGDAVAGIPVFLEPYDLDPRKRLAEVRAIRTNAAGQYQFGGLAPGVYRLLGTFDYQMPDSSEMQAASAKTVKVEEGTNTVLDLDEFVIH